jgi:hypothetical protein
MIYVSSNELNYIVKYVSSVFFSFTFLKVAAKNSLHAAYTSSVNICDCISLWGYVFIERT